jgi:hypothetical protein
MITVLPIAERELRVASRAARTYWSRALAAVVVIVMALVIFDSYERMGRSKVGGQQVFAWLAYLGVAYALFAGAALTADCLSSEKREDTLGFLFLTDLKGYDVVLGKLFATSLRSVYGLLSTFPILSLSLVLGGVQAGEFWRVILVILNTLLLSLSVGLYVSTLFRKQKVTTHAAAGTMLFLAVVPMGLGWSVQQATGAVPWPVEPRLLSPWYLLETAFDPAYTTGALTGWGFWQAWIVQFLLAVLLLARASWLLPHRWQTTEPRVPRSPARVEERRDEDRVLRREMLDINPFYWLAGRGSGVTLGMAAVIALVWAWGFAAADDRDDFAAVQGVGLLLVSLVWRLLLAVTAAQRFAEDKQSGALDLILTTPIGVPALLAGQWRAIWRKLGWPFIGTLALYAYLIFGGPSGWSSSEQEIRAARFTRAVFFILTFADSIALGWMGMWAGLQYKLVPNGAALCLCRVVLPPALLAGFFIMTRGLTNAYEYLNSNPYLVPALWLVAGLATDYGWSVWARKKLATEFRTAATERFQPSGFEYLSRLASRTSSQNRQLSLQ